MANGQPEVTRWLSCGFETAFLRQNLDTGVTVGCGFLRGVAVLSVLFSEPWFSTPETRVLNMAV